MEISRAAFDAIVAHAREAAPRECCGLLIGLGAQIESAHRARNVDPSSTRFLIDPHDHFAAIRAARAGGREVVGVVVLLGAVAALATYLPARRASQIAPVEALRYQ